MRIPALVIPLLLVLGCNADPVTTGAPLPPDDAAVSTPESSDWVVGSYAWDYSWIVPCLGESAHFYGERLFKWHTVPIASGGFHVNYQLVPFTTSGGAFVVVESSGKVYKAARGSPVPVSWHGDMFPGDVFTQVARDVYVAENLDRIIDHWSAHLTINANGEVKVIRGVWAGETWTECFSRGSGGPTVATE